jgi:hypothetical protein
MTSPWCYHYLSIRQSVCVSIRTVQFTAVPAANGGGASFHLAIGKTVGATFVSAFRESVDSVKYAAFQATVHPTYYNRPPILIIELIHGPKILILIPPSTMQRVTTTNSGH